MKSNFLLTKLMLLLCLLVGSVNGAWGTDKTMTFVQTSSSAGNLSGEVPSGVTATFKNTYSTKDQLTGGNSMTLTLSGWSSDVTITGVTLQVRNNKSSGNGTATVKIGDTVLGTLSITNLGSTYQEKQLVITPTKTTSDLVITIVATANSAFCNKFVISYAEVADERAATTVTIDDTGITNRDVYLGSAAGKLSAIVKAGDAAIDGATVTWESETESVATIASDGTVTLVGAGSTVITASYAGDAENYKPSTATYTLTVTNSDPNVPGTENNPYTVAEARAAIDAGTGLTDVYAKGIVSQVDGYNDTYKSITYWISDDGTTTNQLEVYSGKGIGGADFSSEDDVQVGDEVVIKGTLKKYNSTYEFDKNNQLVSLKRKANPELSFANTSVNVNLGDAFVAPVLINPYHVTVAYSSDDTDVATVDPSTGEVTILAKGEATITASFAGDATYLADDASYTITVIDPNEKGTVTNPYTVAEVIAMDTAPTENVYVHGFVVGFMKSGPTLSTNPSDFEVSNCALADAADESNVDNAMAVQFSNNAARAKLNLKDCPYNLNVGKYLLLGKIQKAFGKKGLSSTLAASKKIAEKIDITAAGMATYYTDCALDFTGLTDMYAYIVTENGGSNYSLTRVNKVPANTGLLLYNPNGGVASNVVPVLTEAAEDVTGNALTGTLTEITAGANDYILNNGAEGVGFYKSNSNAIGMHRAYLTSTAGSRPFFLINFDSEATGISFVGCEASMNNRFFNLNGQQVKTPQKGLYIVNGKKVIVK